MHGVHNGTSPSYLTDATTPIRNWQDIVSFVQQWIRYPSHQDKIWRQSFLCCWTTWVECSSHRYKEHYRLVILQTSHQDTFFIGIFGLNSFTFPDCTMFGASGQLLGWCRMCHINVVYLLTHCNSPTENPSLCVNGSTLKT